MHRARWRSLHSTGAAEGGPEGSGPPHCSGPHLASHKPSYPSHDPGLPNGWRTQIATNSSALKRGWRVPQTCPFFLQPSASLSFLHFPLIRRKVNHHYTTKRKVLRNRRTKSQRNNAEPTSSIFLPSLDRSSCGSRPESSGLKGGSIKCKRLSARLRNGPTKLGSWLLPTLFSQGLTSPAPNQWFWGVGGSPGDLLFCGRWGNLKPNKTARGQNSSSEAN